ncbi:hypothetical protein PB2503_00200 [Parvularcula bermudensis HTCC2503]|uniref:Potassium channel domain-containing protein n=1 Tax=Parvularcula bermudensis (strain ATCC BAA-594 / HTCC2503 / KCTC 12087) TaxID=314260 RepID=E0THZ8_PARBH|nr:ion channel [Parvularcula bermudensis]ADM10809.1 hypothetical protein PB2503_00200 [Parvularcula bermudensis HTCC2503]
MLHWEILNRVSVRTAKLTAPRFGIICLGLILLHFAEVGLYAAGFELGRAVGIGTFSKPPGADFMDVYYFSLATFTTLGLGKAMPEGHLAFIAGVEAFNGFLCISMSASMLFKLMPEVTKSST